MAPWLAAMGWEAGLDASRVLRNNGTTRVGGISTQLRPRWCAAMLIHMLSLTAAVGLGAANGNRTWSKFGKPPPMRSSSVQWPLPYNSAQRLHRLSLSVQRRPASGPLDDEAPSVRKMVPMKPVVLGVLITHQSKDHRSPDGSPTGGLCFLAALAWPSDPGVREKGGRGTKKKAFAMRMP